MPAPRCTQCGQPARHQVAGREYLGPRGRRRQPARWFCDDCQQAAEQQVADYRRREQARLRAQVEALCRQQGLPMPHFPEET